SEPPQGSILSRLDDEGLFLYTSSNKINICPIQKVMILHKCSSCNREVTNDYVSFNCPACGKEKIIRCDFCRQNIVQYTCKSCGYTGP
ncbi:MAG: zinc finger domain-containing protein, partial [archaeon]